MMTTIEKLYYGQIRPHEKHVDPESRFAVLQDLLSSSDEDLMRLLPVYTSAKLNTLAD